MSAASTAGRDQPTSVLSHLGVLAKIAIPAAVIAVVCVGLVSFAAISLRNMAESADSIIRGNAKQIELALDALTQFNSAAVTEKNVILYAQDSDIAKGVELYRRINEGVLRTLDALAAVTDEPDETALIQTFRAAVRKRGEIDTGVFDLAMKHRTAEAFALSAGEAARQRRIAIAAADKLLAINRGQLEEQRVAANALALRGQVVLIVTAAFGLGVAFFLLGWIAIVHIRRPLHRMTTQMDRLASGDLKIDIIDSGRRDEVGNLARALRVFQQAALHTRQLEAEQQQEMQRRERRHHAVDAQIDGFQSSTREALAALAAASDELDRTAQDMAATADDTTRQSADAAAGSAQTSANAHTIAAATEQLAASVRRIAQQVAEASVMAREAVDDAHRTNGKMQVLTAASTEIGAVLALIRDIAGQTNLLALNATIEAARAGEHGKGFAVVASEVKTLAGQTARATHDIAEQIGAIQAATQEALEAIAAIGERISQIDTIAAEISHGMEEQGQATLEIARTVQEAASSSQSVTTSVTGVKQAANRTGEAAGSVLRSAAGLAQQGVRLRGDIDAFLAKMRAA